MPIMHRGSSLLRKETKTAPSAHPQNSFDLKQAQHRRNPALSCCRGRRTQPRILTQRQRLSAVLCVVASIVVFTVLSHLISICKRHRERDVFTRFRNSSLLGSVLRRLASVSSDEGNEDEVCARLLQTRGGLSQSVDMAPLRPHEPQSASAPDTSATSTEESEGVDATGRNTGSVIHPEPPPYADVVVGRRRWDGFSWNYGEPLEEHFFSPGQQGGVADPSENGAQDLHPLSSGLHGPPTEPPPYAEVEDGPPPWWNGRSWDHGPRPGEDVSMLLTQDSGGAGGDSAQPLRPRPPPYSEVSVSWTGRGGGAEGSNGGGVSFLGLPYSGPAPSPPHYSRNEGRFLEGPGGTEVDSGSDDFSSVSSDDGIRRREEGPHAVGLNLRHGGNLGGFIHQSLIRLAYACFTITVFTLPLVVYILYLVVSPVRQSAGDSMYDHSAVNATTGTNHSSNTTRGG